MQCRYCSNRLRPNQKICPRCGRLVKPPFYKSGWMWLFPILFTFTILAVFTPNYDSIKANPPPLAYTYLAKPTPSSSTSTTLSHGTFIVGDAILPGRYTITTSQGTGHLSISHSDVFYINEVLTYPGKVDSTVGVTQIETDLVKGDRIDISGLNEVVFNSISPCQKTTLTSGYHMVGRDVPPGIYAITVPEGSGNFVVYNKKHLPRINQILESHPTTYTKPPIRIALYKGDLIKISSLDKVNLLK